MAHPERFAITRMGQFAKLSHYHIVSLLFFSLLTAVFPRQTFGAVLFQQSIQQSPDTAGGSGSEKDVRALEVGKPVRRDMAGGQEHAYRIELKADQFLKVIVEQKWVDVVAQVSGPDGKQILEFDSEIRLYGQEEVSLVAEAAGDFLLIIRPKLNGASGGSYEIRIEELRDATAMDRALHDARKQFSEAIKLENEGRYDEALQLYERVLETREKLLGGEDLDVVASIESVVDSYVYKGQYVRAEPLIQRAIAINEKALGKDHPATSQSVSRLAQLYYLQGKYVDAQPLFDRAIAIDEKALGEYHPRTALDLHNLAALYSDQGKYKEAEALYKRELGINEKMLGEDHRDTASCLNDLAALYYEEGKYKEAEPLYKRALDIRERTLGENHPHTANSLNSLALLYTLLSRYEEAEALYNRALEIRERALGKNHPVTATSLNNLGDFYNKLGKYKEAEALYNRSLEIRENVLGKDHPATANSLFNLAALYRRQRRYDEAALFFKRALDIREKKLGKDHPITATTLGSLGGLYAFLGKYEEAESLLRRALEIREKASGKDNPLTAYIFNNLGILYQRQGKYDEGEMFFKRAQEICEKALGQDHPNTFQNLNSLVMLYTGKGDFVQAVKLQSLANNASERNIAYNLVTRSERDKLAYLAILFEQTDRTISLHLNYAPGSTAARDMAATMILQRKGRALDATSQNLNALRRRFNAEDQELLDRLTETRSQIARLVLRGPQRMTVEQHQAKIKELEGQADKDEADISRKSKEFLAQALPVTLEAVREAIPPDSALIEFASYRPFNARALTYGQPRYVAYVLHHDGKIGWKDLGDAGGIDSSVAAFRNALRDQESVDVKRRARAVDAKIFQPIRPLLRAKRRLLISPDGSLNLIPFAALLDERGRYVVERYSISYLSSGRDLLRLQVARESKDGPLIVAGPDFGGRNRVLAPRSEKYKKETPEGGEDGDESARAAFKDVYFPPLPGAQQEGEALRALLPDATLLTKGQATKATLSQIHAPKLLHIATHGFFLEDQELISTGERGSQSLTDNPGRDLEYIEQRGVRIESPLLRSGLALADANEHKKDDNGILTALEMTGLNLWGTKLVVLSACDTGLGEVKNGDGVYGLRRALALAGSETQLMSLWAISDTATRELMVSYYSKLRQGRGRGEALRQAQFEMLKQAHRRHPYYWASFIQSGEWANLDGKR